MLKAKQIPHPDRLHWGSEKEFFEFVSTLLTPEEPLNICSEFERHNSSRMLKNCNSEEPCHWEGRRGISGVIENTSVQIPRLSRKKPENVLFSTRLTVLP